MVGVAFTVIVVVKLLAAVLLHPATLVPDIV